LIIIIELSAIKIGETNVRIPECNIVIVPTKNNEINNALPTVIFLIKYILNKIESRINIYIRPKIPCSARSLEYSV
jgi:hypothetical protein